MTIDTERTQARVAELLAEYGIPSAAIGVLHNGQLTEFAVGVKNVETREPATVDTVYQCGSMTKTWTALAFMQLVDLDEPVRTYLPGFTVADAEASADSSCATGTAPPSTRPTAARSARTPGSGSCPTRTPPSRC